MTMSLPYHCPPGAVSPALKPLNTLGLASPYLPGSARNLFASDVGRSGIELTSTGGLMTISPEGGP